MPTIPEIINIAKISQYLAANDLAKKGNSGLGVDKRLPRKIYQTRKTVERRYDQDPADDTLTGTSNYLYALCGKYGLEAQNVVGSGGTVASVSSSSAPTRLDFLVSASSFLPTGTTTFTFPASWQGFNMDFIRGGVPQTMVVTEPTYFSWDRTTRIFTCSPGLLSDELIAIIPV